MHPPADSSPGNGHLVILAVSVLVLLASFLIRPGVHGELIIRVPWEPRETAIHGVCLVRSVLGVRCPGCGLTRSFVALSHGRFREALLFNPMGPILYLVCLVQIPYRLAERFRPRDRSALRAWVRDWSDLFLWIIVAGLVAQWITRPLWAY